MREPAAEEDPGATGGVKEESAGETLFAACPLAGRNDCKGTRWSVPSVLVLHKQGLLPSCKCGALCLASHQVRAGHNLSLLLPMPVGDNSLRLPLR